MSNRSRNSRLNQALWIAAGVAVLTVVIVVLSWLTTGGDPAADAERAPTAPVTTTQVERSTFAPEEPRGARAEPPPSSPTPAVAVENLPAEGGEAPPPVPPTAAPSTAPAAAPLSVTPAPPPAPAAPPPAPPAAAAGGFGVQVGAFGSEASVLEMKSKLERLGYKVITRPKGSLTRVIAAGYPDRPAAEKALQKLRAQGLGTAQIVPLE